MKTVTLKNLAKVQMLGKQPGEIFVVDALPDGRPRSRSWREYLDQRVVEVVRPAPQPKPPAKSPKPAADSAASEATPKRKGKG